MISIECRAKVNLYLRVTGRRADGFHDLETLFAEIDLADHLTWQPGDEPLRLEVVGAELGEPAENLVMRAAVAFAAAAGVRVGGRFQLRKAIPVGGGLGGGSADAAGTLLLLNRHFCHPLDAVRLRSLALELGSDVPFFLQGGCCLGRGRGELLEPRPLPSEVTGGWLLVPGIVLSTAAVFQALRPVTGDRPAAAIGENDLLAPALLVSPRLARVWQTLAPLFSADPVFMTGSGSTLVVLTERRSPSAAQATALAAESVGWCPFRFIPYRDPQAG